MTLPGPSGVPDLFVAAGQLLARLNVLFVFVDEATTQAPAHAGDFRLVEGEALRFGHADGDGAEVGEESRAAAQLAASTISAEVFGDVARAG